jgi:hypothetical protein
MCAGATEVVGVKHKDRQAQVAIAARLKQSSTFCTLAAFGKVLAKVKEDDSVQPKEQHPAGRRTADRHGDIGGPTDGGGLTAMR